NGSPPAGLMWMEQLSPHLQRNKQLQDTLLQREEELARLQEENNKLREFLNSSFVRDLEKKAKVCSPEPNLTYVNDGLSENCGHQHLGPHQISKRVCRNLTAEFCSETHETSVSSEPKLDLWVLRTLGLKDRDTIDTSNETLSSSRSSLRSLVYDTAVISSPEQTSLGERVDLCPTLLSSPVTNAPWMPISSTNPSAKPQRPATPHMPRSRTDLAFSMSLSPSSSVKTHSFPQGQAFVRKDSEGRWNFTWVPRQEP
uniref:Geminin coiled-coil domain containing n=1 Tax=Anabas testudineus TaxID=64144 RepID=A0A3Q1H213_ANATE